MKYTCNLRSEAKDSLNAQVFDGLAKKRSILEIVIKNLSLAVEFVMYEWARQHYLAVKGAKSE